MIKFIAPRPKKDALTLDELNCPGSPEVKLPEGYGHNLFEEINLKIILKIFNEVPSGTSWNVEIEDIDDNLIFNDELKSYFEKYYTPSDVVIW